MTHEETPIDAHDAQRLRDFGDALVGGNMQAPQSDIEATMVRVQQALAATPKREMHVPDDVRKAIWEDLMHAKTGYFTAPHPLPATHLRERPAQSSTKSATKPLFRPHFPAFFNVALILGLLYGMVALFTLEQNPDGDRGDTSLANQVLYDPGNISSFPRVPDECVPNGEVPKSDIPQDPSFEDWTAPEYIPVKAVSHERGVAIQETFLAYQRCEQNDFNALSPEATAAAAFTRSPESLSYFSDRMRYNLLATDLSATQQEELDAFRCLPRNDQILESFPLPVNQPTDYAILELTADDRIRYLQFIFAPSDVYQLPDGRYGAIMGSISPEALTNPDELRSDDYLQFIAFVEQDGRFYIDEMFLVLGADTRRPIVNRPEGSLPLTEVVYEPYDIPECTNSKG